MAKRYQGSCLCGQVRFEASGFSPQAAHCHCTMCRKFHGAAFGTLVKAEQLHWLAGKEWLKEFQAANGTIRTFCSQCGSSLGFRAKGCTFEDIEIAIATFDEPIPVNIDANIYTDYKANWLAITDELPAFKEGRIRCNDAD